MGLENMVRDFQSNKQGFFRNKGKGNDSGMEPGGLPLLRANVITRALQTVFAEVAIKTS